MTNKIVSSFLIDTLGWMKKGLAYRRIKVLPFRLNSEDDGAEFYLLDCTLKTTV